MKRLLYLSLILCIIIAMLSCDKATGIEDTGRINAFAISSTLVADGEDFAIQMDITVPFLANIYLRELTTTGGIDTSIFYTSAYAEIPSSIAFRYNSENLYYNDEVVAKVKTGINYKLYAKVCDFNNSCIVSNRATIAFGFAPPDGGGGVTPPDNNTIDLGYLLLGDDGLPDYPSRLFFASTLEKKIPVKNSSNADATVTLTTIGATNFTYKFSNGTETITLVAGASDDLIVGSTIPTLPSPLPDSLSSNVFAPPILTTKKVIVKPVALSTGTCGITGIACDLTKPFEFTMSATEVVSAFAIDQKMVDKFAVITNAKLEFATDFFTKFKKDSRTTCVIDTTTNTIALDKQCFVFISRDIAGATSTLTATGTGIGNAGVNTFTNGATTDSITFTFNAN